MAVATVTDDQNVNFQLVIKHLYYIEAVPNVACVLMEINHCFVLQGIFLLYEPSMQSKVILGLDFDILILHISFGWIPIRLGVALGISEGLIWRIGYVKHPILHEVNHEKRECEEEPYVKGDLEQELQHRHYKHF